jgi:hypothetical protein
MSIRFNHAAGTITSTDTATIVIEGGTPTVPRPLRLNASSIVFPNKTLPIGEAGAVVFDTASQSLKYHNGISWVELLSQDDILAPVNISLTDIYNQLGERVSTVSYSSSSVAAASISGTNLNIVFPTSTTGGEVAIPGLFTSSPPGSIMHYSLSSGQTVESIREQLSGVTNGQDGRNGTQASPYVTKTGWCFGDGLWWTWNGETPVTKQVPNLNQDAYLKGITTSGVTKTDSVIVGTGTVSSTSITEPQHYHGTGMMLGLSGGRADDAVFIYGKTFNDGFSYNGLRINGENNAREGWAVSGSDNRVAFSTTFAIYPNGNTSTHTHNLSNVDVNHFNAAIVYNIAEPSLALNETAGDARYVLKAGDTMTGSLTIANSATIRANDTSLVLWFQNSLAGERAAIYHNSTNNTLRFRSSGGPEVTLSNTGVLTAPSLAVSTQSATVNGKNIVRTVNGVDADANGAVNITAGVEDIRFSARAILNNSQFVRYSNGRAGYVPDGSVVVGMADVRTDEIFIEDVDQIFYRYLQKQIAGVWYTVGVL